MKNKGLVIGGVLLLTGIGVWYFFFKKKPEPPKVVVKVIEPKPEIKRDFPYIQKSQ